MKLVAVTKLDGIQYLEFELRSCRTYVDRRHINQTCHNKFEHCWKNAHDEKGVESSIANCIALYPNFEPHVTGEFFEKETAS